MLKDPPEDSGYIPPERVKNAVVWMSGVEARIAARQQPTDSKEDPPIIPPEALVVMKMFKSTKQVKFQDNFFGVLRMHLP